ncbi:MAG: restriction endonuclease subunit S [Deltaproteobacteria bacterium]|nr:restriction endonuclease subunit S [Myxococcales bacterium]MDP3216976.1 restriction endonuclease subunit S [Deltaproteobacteria bacterium]
MGEQWTTSTLGACVSVSSGGTPSKARPEYWGGSVPWVSCKDMKVDRIYDSEDHLTLDGAANGTRWAPVGSILIVVRGMILAREFPVGLVIRPVTFNQDLKALETLETLEPKFLYYWLKARTYDILGVVDEAGHGTKRLQSDRLMNQPIRFPSRSMQRRMVDVLCAYDDLIENSQKRIVALDEMVRAIFRACVINGQPSVPLATPTAQELINDGVIEINDGYRAKNSELGQPGLPFARAGNIDDGFHMADADMLHESNVGRAGAKVSREGDVVFTSKGTVGRFAWVRSRTPRFVYSPQLCFWRVLRPDVLSPRYLCRWMKSPAFVMQLDRVKGSTDMADYVSLTDQRRMRVDVPPQAVQREFDAAAAPLDDLIDSLRERIATLRATRDLLLPRLISGELDVSRVPDPASL